MAKTAAGRSAGKTVVALKVTLRDVKPPVWRRLLLPGTMTLADLHEAIQAAMGWHGGHLHGFEVAGRQYGDPRTIDDVADETKLTLNSLLKSGVARFTYTYDFGGNWEHQVLIEQPQPAAQIGRGSFRRDAPRPLQPLTHGFPAPLPLLAARGRCPSLRERHRRLQQRLQLAEHRIVPDLGRGLYLREASTGLGQLPSRGLDRRKVQ